MSIAIECTIQYIIEYAIEHTEETTIENTITYAVEYARGRWHLVLAGERRVCKHPVGGSALPSIWETMLGHCDHNLVTKGGC